MEPPHLSTKSGHVGAAEGKNSGGGGYTGSQAIRESSAAGPAGLWSQPRPRFMQAHLYLPHLGGGPRVIPQSQRLHGLPKVIQLALTIRIEARPPYLLSLTFGRGVGRGSGRSRLQGFLECAQWGTFEQS